MSSQAPPSRLPRRSSQVRFSGNTFNTPSNAMPPRARYEPPGPITERSQRLPSFDIADHGIDHGLYPTDSQYDGGPGRFSAVPFHPGDGPPESRRGSDDTVTEFDGEEQSKVGINGGHSQPRRQRTVPDDGHYTRPNPQRSYSDASHDHHHGHRGHAHDHRHGHHRDAESGQKKSPGGLFNLIKNAFAHVTKDQEIPSCPDSRAPSRRNSFGSAMSPDNFERTLDLNNDVEETDPYQDSDERHRSNNEYGKGPEISRPGLTARRMSYSERRKREKHTIKYCAEPVPVYQKFTLTFSKALLCFGSPSHRIESQLNSLAKVFQIEAQFHHTTGTIQVSFGNPESRTSETCLIKSPVGLALGRIHSVHNIYRAVIHDEMYASDGTRELRKLLEAPPRYGTKTRLILAFLTCLLICGIAFGGSLNDMWVAGVAGFMVRIVQIYAAKSELSASGSEVFSAALVALLARGLASVNSQIWCFTAISSAGVISMLPGFLILQGSLDIAGKNIALGTPKIVSGIMTSLYLGFGLTLGSDVFLFFDKGARAVLAGDSSAVGGATTIEGLFLALNGTVTDNFNGTFTFSNSTTALAPNIINGCYRAPEWSWYLQPMPWWALFFLVPLFALFSSMNNQQHWWSRQMFVMVAIACISFTFTRLANAYWDLANHPDYVSLIGSFSVGVFGNGYSRKFGGTAFTSMLTGILLLVPDGLSAAGGLAQNYNAPGEDEYTQSLTLARKMISVIIGIMAGVYSSAALVYFFGKKKNAALVTF